MIATIILTATITAACVMALTHRKTSYVADLEQSNLARAETISELTVALSDANIQVGGLISSNQLYRERLKAASRGIDA